MNRYSCDICNDDSIQPYKSFRLKNTENTFDVCASCIYYKNKLSIFKQKIELTRDMFCDKCGATMRAGLVINGSLFFCEDCVYVGLDIESLNQVINSIIETMYDS